jgi:hypothetical protein
VQGISSFHGSKSRFKIKTLFRAFEDAYKLDETEIQTLSKQAIVPVNYEQDRGYTYQSNSQQTLHSNSLHSNNFQSKTEERMRPFERNEQQPREPSLLATSEPLQEEKITPEMIDQLKLESQDPDADKLNESIEKWTGLLKRTILVRLLIKRLYSLTFLMQKQIFFRNRIRYFKRKR